MRERKTPGVQNALLLFKENFNDKTRAHPQTKSPNRKDDISEDLCLIILDGYVRGNALKVFALKY